MTYRTILLHLDNESQAPALVKFASDVAEKFNAHLVGLFVIHPIQMYVGLADGLSPGSDLSRPLVKEQVDKMERLKKIFDQETESRNFVAEWRSIDERAMAIADTVLQEATSADVLIIGQKAGVHFDLELAKNIMLASPVPIIVVPENLESTTFGENVVIAWDGGAEAARAVVGAKPFLE